MKKPIHPVTDHAVVRYLERVQGMDIDEIRRDISAKVERGLDLGASGVVLDAFVYRIKSGRVVTVVPHCSPSPGQHKQRGRVQNDD